MIDTLDKLVRAVQRERERRGGEGRRVFLHFDSATDLQYDLTAREASGFLRSEKKREVLRQRLNAASIEYRPSEYHRASGRARRRLRSVPGAAGAARSTQREGYVR